MTEQHEWTLLGNPRNGVCWALNDKGDKLDMTEIEARLNEYETLEAENAELKLDLRKERNKRNAFEFDYKAQLDLNVLLTLELETLKKATDEMRECLSFFASVIKSGEPWTDACEKAYADILEGKDG